MQENHSQRVISHERTKYDYHIIIIQHYCFILLIFFCICFDEQLPFRKKEEKYYYFVNLDPSSYKCFSMLTHKGLILSYFTQIHKTNDISQSNNLVFDLIRCEMGPDLQGLNYFYYLKNVIVNCSFIPSILFYYVSFRIMGRKQSCGFFVFLN